MVWYFNFCSPHLTDDNMVNINRMAMVSQLLAGMIIAFVLHMLAELYQKDKQIDQEEQQAQNNQNLSQSDHEKNMENSAVSLKKHMDNFSVTKSKQDIEQTKKEGGFFTKDNKFFLSVETVQNRVPAFLGHFSIGIGACMMYSPFIYQSILGLVYLIVIILMIFFDAWKFRRSLIAMVGLSYVINISLITSALIGLGLSNWDYHQLKKQQLENASSNEIAEGQKCVKEVLISTNPRNQSEKQISDDKSQQEKPLTTKNGIQFWTKSQNKIFVSFLVFYFDKMDIFPHPMDYGTFNFMSCYVETKTRNQCRTHFQRYYKTQKRMVHQMICTMLKRKDESKQTLEETLQNQKKFIKQRLNYLKSNGAKSDYYKYSDKIDEQLSLLDRNIQKIVLKIGWLKNQNTTKRSK